MRFRSSKILLMIIFTGALLLANSVSAQEPNKMKFDNEGDVINFVISKLAQKEFEQSREILSSHIKNNSPYYSVAELLIADAYLLQGGGSNYTAAATYYQSWLRTNHHSDLSPQVLSKLLSMAVRLRTHRKLFYDVPIIAKMVINNHSELLNDQKIVDCLALLNEDYINHNFGVAKFYFERKDANIAARARLMDILERAEKYTKMDQVYWMLAQISEAEDQVEAINYYQKIVLEFANSQYKQAAIERLKHFNIELPIPTLASYQKTQEYNSYIERLINEVNTPQKPVPQQGIILDSFGNANTTILRQLIDQ